MFASVMFLGLTAYRPGFDPVRQTISELLVGPDARLVSTMFVIYGLVLLAGVAPSIASAWRGRRGVALTAAIAVLLAVGCMVLPLAPPEPWPPSSMTWLGVAHLWAAGVLFTGMPALCLSLARLSRDDARWPRFSMVSAAVGALCATIFVAGVIDLATNTHGFSATHLGLVERAEVYLFVAWQGVLSLNLWRATGR
jgi:hypothetical protein